MAMGLPVVATDCGGPSDFVNESNGCLVPVDDVDKASAAMNRVREHYSTYNLQQISNDICQKYSPAMVAHRLTTIYQSVL
jgi:glycosyltransferase involved in cell wall biosynthesis